jgi:hypothetical protein
MRQSLVDIESDHLHVLAAPDALATATPEGVAERSRGKKKRPGRANPPEVPL